MLVNTYISCTHSTASDLKGTANVLLDIWVDGDRGNEKNQPWVFPSAVWLNKKVFLSSADCGLRARV